MPGVPYPALPAPPVVARMQALVQQWQAAHDAKHIFLHCYQLMTSNTLAAIDRHEFQDSAWVNRLLHRFADYYFEALEVYEQQPAAAPLVWQFTHACAGDARCLPLQNLVLGVNAHINYDLVLTLAEVLRPEWPHLSAPQRAARYADHGRVNAVIAGTIDAVQAEVLEPVVPGAALLDEVLGRLDERLAARLIAGWRESVWQNAVRLLGAATPTEQAALVQAVEAEALRLGRLIRGPRPP